MLNKILDPASDKNKLETILPTLDCNNCDQFSLTVLLHIKLLQFTNVKNSSWDLGWGVLQYLGNRYCVYCEG